ICGNDGQAVGSVSSGDDLTVELEFVVETRNPALCVGFDLADSDGSEVFRTYQTDCSAERRPRVHIGLNRWRCSIPRGLLNGRTYTFSPRFSIHNVYWIVRMDAVLRFDVLLDHGDSPFWNSLSGANRPGPVAPILRWDVVRESVPDLSETRPAARSFSTGGLH